MSAGKGDGSRPFSVPWDKFSASHDAIFKCAVCGEKKSKCVCCPTDDGPGQIGEVDCCCVACLDDSGETTDFLGMQVPISSMMMVVCQTCGNKRCPHATDHRHACTNSNELGQPGSRYGDKAAAATGGEVKTHYERRGFEGEKE